MVRAFGAAFLFSNSAAILTYAFSSNERSMAFGINQVSTVVGWVTGLILGGFLTTLLGWRSIFWVNILIGIFATVWSHYRLREMAELEGRSGIDFSGNIAFAGSLSLRLLGVTAYSLGALAAETSSIMMTGGGAMLLLFFLLEKRVKHPMFNLTLFRIGLLMAGNLAIFLNALSRGAVTLVLSF